MGVLTCSRRDCDNIMCAYYVPSVGYICNDCKDEFIRFVNIRGIRVDNDADVESELQMFMSSPSGKFNEVYNSFDLADYFNRHFR